MGNAYTPGLKISANAVIRKTRRLPLKGELAVKVGDKVNAETIVARTDIPGVILTIRAAEILGLDPAETLRVLNIKLGDKVTAGQVIGETKSFFGLFKSECKSNFTGTVELISSATGHVGVRMPPKPVEVDAYIDGVISEVIENEGVVVEASGAVVQGIFGIGGERTGKLICPLSSPDEILTEDFITSEQKGAIVAGGARVTLEALKKASELGVCGIITGSAADTDIIGYLGYDIGVAITGQENIVTSVILTEGFGDISMANKTFNLLKSLDGRKVSINGATQIRAGVIRPELIAPFETSVNLTSSTEDEFTLEIGSNIRIIREPYFGLIGKVTELPPTPVEIESGAIVRILKAKLSDGQEVQVPRSNVEIIQE